MSTEVTAVCEVQQRLGAVESGEKIVVLPLNVLVTVTVNTNVRLTLSSTC